jgi:hypothetical protein
MDLEYQQAVTEEASKLIPTHRSATEVCPWLDLTQWARYVQGHEFAVLSQLAALPHPNREPLLAILVERVNYLVLLACQSIREKKINEFDLMRINSVLHRTRVWDRPLFIDFQDTTRQRYGRVWQRLICFPYRSTRSDTPVQLSHRLTRSQRAWLDQMIHHAAIIQDSRCAYQPQAACNLPPGDYLPAVTEKSWD